MEEGGARRIVVVIAIAAVALIGVFWYWQHAKQRVLRSGDVYVKSQTSDQAGLTPPTSSGSTESAPPDSSTLQASSNVPFAQPAPKPSAAIETVHVAQAAPAEQPPMTQPRGAVEVPASDTIPRNPPSGLIFAGAGKYQLYRQGDITWRLDTDNGRACIIFATDTQWSRMRVYDQGCGVS